MSALVLVRHGQASFFSDEYDRLSDLGRRQARCLAEHWRRAGLQPDVLYTGPLVRQRDTALELVKRLGELGGRELPLEEMAEWSEYDGTLLASGWSREMARANAGGKDGAQTTTEERAAHAAEFQRAFEVMMRDWIMGERVVDGAESWSEFKGRVIDGFERIVADHPKGDRVAVVSSGGAIAVVLGHVLGLEDLVTLELNWTMRNCAVSEVLYNREKRSLSTYNCTAHLEPDLLTYR